MEVVLVRHGATDWNLQGRCQGSTDRDLSEVGVRQAENLSALLSRQEIDAIYSSHLQRARRTAEIINQPHKLPVLIEEDVRELDHGELEGLTFNEIKSNYTDFLLRWRSVPAEVRVPGGEGLAEVTDRAWKALTQIIDRHSNAGRVLVVSHNFPILGIVCRVTGTHLNEYRNFHLDPCSVTRLGYNAGNGWQLTHVNSREYTPQATFARP